MKTLIRAGLVGALLVATLAEIRAEEPAAEAYTWGVRARLKEMDGDIDGAIADYDKAIAVYPQDAQPFNARAILKKEKGDLAGAIADFDRAIALKPEKDLATIYGNRGSAKHESGDLDGALADYTAALALAPDQAVIYNNLGIIRQAKADLERALGDFSKAIALQPDNGQFYANRAAARQEKGDLEGARGDFDKTIALDPERAGAYYARGNFLRFSNDLDGALADFAKLNELKPDVWIGYHCQAVTQQAKGELEAAIANYDKALAVAGEDADYILPYREIALRQLDRGTPFAELAKTVGQAKDSWSKTVGLYLVEVLSEQDFLAKAEQGGADSVRLHHCAATYYIGMTRLLAGDEASARKYFEQSVAENLPDSDEFILARAELARLGK